MTISVGSCTYDVEMGPHQRFWKQVRRGDWEPETFAIFDRFIDSETLFIDVGAWIGPTALYGVQRANRCIAFEPDPVAFGQLQQNITANAGKEWVNRLEINQCAINKDGASFTLGGSAEGADSTSSALFPDRDSQWTVRARRLQDILAENRTPGMPVFIKIDIEGGEYELLPTIGAVLADLLVTAYISFHPRMLRESVSLLNEARAAQEAFVSRHVEVLNSLPWERSIKKRDGTSLQRAALEKMLKRHSRFPREILIG